MSWDKRIEDAEPSWAHFIGIMGYAMVLAMVSLPWLIIRRVWR